MSGPTAADQVTTVDSIPVGGGVIFPEQGVVITQPVAGEFRAFDTTCPHRGCAVRAVAAGTINCFCHGSRFRVTDGSVAGGPSPAPLAPRTITLTDDVISLG